jgi:hypothetical protein
MTALPATEFLQQRLEIVFRIEEMIYLRPQSGVQSFALLVREVTADLSAPWSSWGPVVVTVVRVAASGRR